MTSRTTDRAYRIARNIDRFLAYVNSAEAAVEEARLAGNAGHAARQADNAARAWVRIEELKRELGLVEARGFAGAMGQLAILAADLDLMLEGYRALADSYGKPDLALSVRQQQRRAHLVMHSVSGVLQRHMPGHKIGVLVQHCLPRHRNPHRPVQDWIDHDAREGEST